MSDNTHIISNEQIDEEKLEKARAVISALYQELPEQIAHGSMPFLAAVYDQDGKLIAKSNSSVVLDTCSSHHAEMNAIAQAEKVFQTYDLQPHNLKLYATGEPCIMCLGAIMWSGIKEVYWGVPTKEIEDMTGLYEGYKPAYMEEFKKLGITVYGNIEADAGKEIIKRSFTEKWTIYKPSDR